MRILRPDEILAVLPDLYDRVAFGRPGVITRPATWYARLFQGAIDQGKASFDVGCSDGTASADGFVHYENAWD
ncbi:MAG: hypothetical protein R2705_21760 [Ilumatobacteraceae bacterium]